MNTTITRDKVVKACKDYYVTKRITLDIAIPIIASYCEEKGKSNEEISKLTQALLTNMQIVEWCFLDSLCFFEVKFTICKLYRIIESSNVKEILNIY